MPLPRSSQFRMADQLAGGCLVEILTAKAAADLPWEVVSRQLYAEYRIDVTGQTLRRWADQLGLNNTPEAASA